MSMMNSKRIEEIQKACAYPESISVMQALLQVWNECSRETTSTNPILKEVAQERERQMGKWGAAADDNWNPLDWHETIADYNGWARRMLCQGSPDKGRRRLIQIAALAIAQVEAIDRRFPDLAMDDHGDHPDRP